MPQPCHIPVLPAEVLHWLNPRPGQIVVDCTVGGGGHTRFLAERVAPGGHVIGLDQDPAMLELAKPLLAGQPVTLVHASFDDLPDVLRKLAVPAVDGVLADLGVCSDQLDNPARGLTFQTDGPLDMRLDPTRGEPASALVNRLSEHDLADLIYQFGEERYNRRIARRIVEARRESPIDSTGRLAEIVRRSVPRMTGRRGRPGIDPATRTFQALRIAVNDELGALDRLLERLPNVLGPEGRAVLISFHSLEDRRVKQAFRHKDVWTVLTKKPVTAADDEVGANPRARSAKLRAAKRSES
jgi:16S rRNA (cytosine1402-N4)-methyltransferase